MSTPAHSADDILAALDDVGPPGAPVTKADIAAEFGERPPNFVPQRPTPGSFTDLLRLGVVPHTDQFADEQELAANQYTLVLERDGECDTSRHPPF